MFLIVFVFHITVKRSSSGNGFSKTLFSRLIEELQKSSNDLAISALRLGYEKVRKIKKVSLKLL